MNTASRFTQVETPEPHRSSRRALLAEHPEIRRLFGHDVRTAYVTFAVVVVQLALAGGFEFVLHGHGWPITFAAAAVAALLVGAVLNHWLAMSIHEATHNLAFKTRGANIALGLLANVPMVMPVAMTFRRYHAEHHAQLGVTTRDTDLPHSLEVRFISRSTWLKALWWAFYAFVYLIRGTTFARRPNRLELVNLAQMVAVNLALWAVLGPKAMAYLFLSTVFAHGLHPVAAHFLHEHYVFAPGQETYSYYGPLNRVTFNVGYHNEHHDLPNVPGWKLPELHRVANARYGALVSHRSWTAVLWRFVTDPGMGVGSRVVRTSAQG